MKKVDLIHTTILIVGILAGYSTIQYFFYLLGSIAYVRGTYTDSYERMLYYIVMIVLFSVACGILVKNGRKYAGMLLKDEPEGSREEAAYLQLDRRNIVFVLFIGLGLYTLIQSVPYVFGDLFELYRNKISSGLVKESSPKSAPLIIELLRTTIGAFLIYAAPALTGFITKKIAVRLDSQS
jgi:hypothetical protein